MSLLNSHPDINAYEELFLMREIRPEIAWVAKGSPKRFFYARKSITKPRPFSTKTYLQSVIEHNQDKKSSGFKLMLAHLARFPELLPLLVLSNFRLIILTRNNIFENCMSQQFNRVSKFAHGTDKSTIQRIKINPKEFAIAMHRRKRAITALHLIKKMTPLKAIHINYDDLSRETESVCKQVFAFLDVAKSDIKIKSKLQKRVVTPPDQAIENYYELLEELSAQNLTRYLPQQTFS